MMGMQLPGTNYNPSTAMMTTAAQGAMTRSGQPPPQAAGPLRVQFEKLAFFNFVFELSAPIRLIRKCPALSPAQLAARR